MEAAFLVASQRESTLEVIALGFDGAASVASLNRNSANAMTVHPRLPIVFLATGNDGGMVTSVDIRNGEISEVAGIGEVPCFLLLCDDDGDDGEPAYLLSVNYGDGSVSAVELLKGHVARVTSHVVFPFEPLPGMHVARQDGSHPHWIGRDGGDFLVTDLGNDVIQDVAFHAGKLKRRGIYRRVPTGAGPRHMCRDDVGGLWASLELSNGVARFGPEAIALAASTNRWLADGVERNHVGDITFEPEAGVVVTANRELGTLGIFARARDGIEPVAEVACGGLWPAQFAQQDGVLAVANRDSDSVAMFDVGPSWWENAPELFDVQRPVAMAAAPLWTESL